MNVLASWTDEELDAAYDGHRACEKQCHREEDYRLAAHHRAQQRRLLSEMTRRVLEQRDNEYRQMRLVD
jgi:hypothetical protein